MQGFVCAIGVALTVANPGARATTHDVLVRVYNTFDVPRHELGMAQRVVERIFDDANVRITWRECRTLGGSSESQDACGEVLQPSEVMIRLVTGPPVRGKTPPAFGYSQVDAETRAGVLATVLVDRVTRAAARVAGNRADLLGLTMAHEISHLLLGTRSHAADGLMRAHWPDAVLRDDARAWRLSKNEAAQIGTALVARVAPYPDTAVGAVARARPSVSQRGTR